MLCMNMRTAEYSTNIPTTLNVRRVSRLKFGRAHLERLFWLCIGALSTSVIVWLVLDACYVSLIRGL
jgi:hypothetical protein